MTKKTGFAPAVGRKATMNQIRTDLDDLSTLTVHSDLDLHIVRLLALHPSLKVRFRNHDIASLDEGTKKLLLDDMNEVLGIRPLKKRSS
jgi:hypothetical protein